MAIRNKTYIKSKFETGDIPTQQDFHDFIDSTIFNDQIGDLTGITKTNDFNSHTGNTNNPHSVTATQINAVPVSGNSTIYNIKTFASPPKVPDPIEDNDVTNKLWVLNNLPESVLTQDLHIVGTDIGALTDGTVIPSGTSFQDLWFSAATKQIAPTYTSPSVSLNSSTPLNVESGTILSPTLTPTFNQNDGGSLIELNYYENGSIIQTQNNTTPYTVPNYTIGDENITYYTIVSYEEGPIKNDNLGNPYPTGRITSGTTTSGSRIYNGLRNSWHDAVSNTNPIDSNYIRGLSNAVLNRSNGSSFTINIPSGTERVIFTYPDTLRDVSSVIYVEGLNSEVKNIFSLQTVSVDGNNNYNPINYKVYVYEPVEPFSASATYIVTI